MLASLAVCAGFGFVRRNPSNTLSVAVQECFDAQTRYVELRHSSDLNQEVHMKGSEV